MCCNAYIKQAVSFTSKANTTQYLHKAKVLGGQKKKKKAVLLPFENQALSPCPLPFHKMLVTQTCKVSHFQVPVSKETKILNLV